jgi:hypothetical protein
MRKKIKLSGNAKLFALLFSFQCANDSEDGNYKTIQYYKKKQIRTIR